MSIASPLGTWVADRLAEGWSLEQIYLTLLQQGHALTVIESAVHEAHGDQRAAALQQRVVRVVLIVGAVLVGAGVFSFIAANWQELAAAGRIALIVAGMLVFSVTGYLIRERTDSRLLGEALLLIGSIIYGAGIFLVAQIYNVQGNWPDGFMMWMIGALVMALAVRSTGLFVLGIALGVTACIGYPFGLLGDGGLDPYLLTSPLLALAGAAVAGAAGLLLKRESPSAPAERW